MFPIEAAASEPAATDPVRLSLIAPPDEMDTLDACIGALMLTSAVGPKAVLMKLTPPEVQGPLTSIVPALVGAAAPPVWRAAPAGVPVLLSATPAPAVATNDE